MSIYIGIGLLVFWTGSLYTAYKIGKNKSKDEVEILQKQLELVGKQYDKCKRQMALYINKPAVDTITNPIDIL